MWMNLVPGEGGLQQRVEGFAGRAVGRAALAGGAVAGAGHAAVQARAALHPRRGGCGAGPVAHAEHRPDHQGPLPPLAGRPTLTSHHSSCSLAVLLRSLLVRTLLLELLFFGEHLKLLSTRLKPKNNN